MRRSAITAAALAAGVGIAVAGCGGGGSASTTTSSTPTTGTSADVPAGLLAAGKDVFLGDSGCAGCHSLANAGSTATVASNLDEKKPTAARVQDVVANGSGAMPPYRKQLTAQQITAVSAYVAWAAGR